MKYAAACIAISALFCAFITACDSGPTYLSVRPPAASSRPIPTRPPAAKVTNQEPWSFIDSSGQVFSTRHFRIFTTATSGIILDRLPSFTESSLARYSTSITDLPAPARQLDTYFLATRAQWARMTQSLMGKEAENLLRIQRGGFAHDGQEIGRASCRERV